MQKIRRFVVVLLAALGMLIASERQARCAVLVANPSFETGVTSWTTTGNVFIGGNVGFGAPSQGSLQAIIDKESAVATIPTLVTFLGADSVQLASVIGDGDLSDLSEAFGSGIKQTFAVPGATSLTFDYNLFTLLHPDNPLVNYPETVVAVLDGTAYFVNDTDHANFTHNNGVNQWSDYSTFTGLPTLGAGSHTIAVATIGGISGAGFQLDNFIVSAAGVPTPASVWAGLVLLPLAYVSRRRLMNR